MLLLFSTFTKKQKQKPEELMDCLGMNLPEFLLSGK